MKLPLSIGGKIPLKLPSKIWYKLFGYGFIIYCVSLIINFPAHIAWQFVPTAATQSIRFNAIEGTIWHGRISGLTISGLDVGQLNWKLKPLSLLLAQLELDTSLNGNNKKMQGKFAFTADGLINGQSISGSLQAAQLNPYTLPISLQGMLTIDIQTLQYQQGTTLSIVGDLKWNNASVDMVQAVELGKVEVVIQPAPNGIGLKVKNSDSALAVDGTITLDVKGLYQTNLGLFNRDPTRTDIATIIQMIGKPDATGRVYLRQRGNLPL
ncbi:MAG: type II secretion system protein N [Gammaproteobacteria bacterium]|nr:type II secretion system protein N [Gammaproteobacteria bacterium]